MDFIAPIRWTALPAIIFLVFLPLWPFVQKHHARLFFTTLSIVCIPIVAGPILAGGLLATIVLAYYPIEWIANRKSGRRMALFVGWLVLHAAILCLLYVPVPQPFRHLRSEDAPWVFILASGIALTFLRLVSHMYDRATGRTRPIPFWDYLCYMVYFPQFRHGPLERSRKFVPKLIKARVNWRPLDVVAGLARVGLGLAVCLSLPLLAEHAPEALRLRDLEPKSGFDPFVQAAELTTLQIVFMVHFIPLVVYMIESSFASVQLGVSRVFGVRGSENFRYPFLSATPLEVWRRWNITVFAWLRDYAYAPLGGGKRHKLLNIVLVFVYCGLLHGLQLRGLVWGLYTGGTLAIFVWLADRWRARRRRSWSTANPGLAPRPNLVIGIPLKLLGILLTMEWIAIGATILVDPHRCGMTMLGEYFRRLWQLSFGALAG